jgi:PhnB protein
LVVHNAAAAIAFYKQAFGAQELARMPAPDGQRVWHAELQIGDSRLMLSDEFPEMSECRAPTSLGATVSLPLMDAFWGDRYGQVTDPFGHQWGIATRQEEVSAEELAHRAEAFATQSA